MAINNFTDIPNLVVYVSGEETVSTISKTGSVVNSIRSAEGTLEDVLLNDSTAEGNVTHASGDPAHMIGSLDAFLVPTATDTKSLFNGTFVEGYTGPLTAVCVWEAVGANVNDQTLFDHRWESQSNQLRLYKYSNNHRYKADNGTFSTTLPVVDGKRYVSIIRWDREVTNVVEYWAGVGGAAAAVHHSGTRGPGFNDPIDTLCLFDSPGATFDSAGAKVGIFLLYNHYVSDDQIEDLNTLCNVWVNTGAPPATDPPPTISDITATPATGVAGGSIQFSATVTGTSPVIDWRAVLDSDPDPNNWQPITSVYPGRVTNETTDTVTISSLTTADAGKVEIGAVDGTSARASKWTGFGVSAAPPGTSTTFGPVTINDPTNATLQWQWRATDQDAWTNVALSNFTVETGPGGPSDPELAEGETKLWINSAQLSDAGQISCLATTAYDTQGRRTNTQHLDVVEASGSNPLLFDANFGALADWHNMLSSDVSQFRPAAVIPDGFYSARCSQTYKDNVTPLERPTIELLDSNHPALITPRNGGSKCFIFWRHAQETTQTSWNGDGMLTWYAGPGISYDELYYEFYIAFSQEVYDSFRGIGTNQGDPLKPGDNPNMGEAKLTRTYHWDEVNDLYNMFDPPEATDPKQIWGIKGSSETVGGLGIRNTQSMRGRLSNDLRPHTHKPLSSRDGGNGDASCNYSNDLAGSGIEAGGSDPVLPDKLNGGNIPTSGNIDIEQIHGAPGAWTKIAFYVKMNSAPGVADGQYMMWLDGTRVILSKEVPWVETGQDMVGWNTVHLGGNQYFSQYPDADRHREWYAIDEFKIYSSVPDGLTTE